VEMQSWLERPFAADTWAMPNGQPVMDIDHGRALAQAIVDTIRQPLLVLDRNLRVVAASRSFYQTFKIGRQDVQGRLVYTLDDRRWNIPELRSRLEKIVPRHTVMEDYEIQQDFSGIGRRTMLLNARKVFYQGNARTLILLAIEDVTERRAAERAMTELMRRKETLLQEMQHRVANTLQIIASILLLKARTVQSKETRLHLQDAHQRVMSVADVQQQLKASRYDDPIELGPYLSRLCEALTASVIGDSCAISLKVHAAGGTVSSSEAVSMGLIVTELVINALKHAFHDRADGQIIVAYDIAETDWTMTVFDNGIGKPEGSPDKIVPGLGTRIVEALAKQLDSRVEISRHPHGTMVSIIHSRRGSSLLPGARQTPA
jgi:two-component sensor histidine kinase